MEEFVYTIKDEVGIHARPAGMLAKTAKEFKSAITIKKGDKSASATKLIALMGLGIKYGDEITVVCEGADEDEAAKAIKAFLNDNL